MLCYFKKSKKDCAVYGRLLSLMRQKWFAKFPSGDYSLNDAPQLSRPVEVDSNQDID